MSNEQHPRSTTITSATESHTIFDIIAAALELVIGLLTSRKSRPRAGGQSRKTMPQTEVAPSGDRTLVDEQRAAVYLRKINV